MPVPVYAPILDSEIEPGDDALSSIFVRLRNNPLAAMGVDTTDPAPSVNPPRQLILKYHMPYHPLGANGYVNNATGTGSVAGAWIDMFDETEAGSLCTLTTQAVSNNQAAFIDISAGAWQVAFNMPTRGVDIGLAVSVNNWRPQVIRVSPKFAAGVFQGMQVCVSNNDVPVMTLFAPPAWTLTGILAAGGPGLAAPSTVTDLYRITASSSTAAIQLEHRKVGTVHQVRFVRPWSMQAGANTTVQIGSFVGGATHKFALKG